VFLKAADQFAVILINQYGSVNCGGVSNAVLASLAILTPLVCLMRFVLVLMNNEDLSPLSFLSPTLSIFLSTIGLLWLSPQRSHYKTLGSD